MSAPDPHSAAIARRNIGLLAVAQSLGGASPAIVISLGGLVGLQLADNKAFATLPVSLLNVGVAVAVIPAAWLMRRHGRRVAYLFGALIGLASGVIAAGGIVARSFELFCLGTLIAGFYGAFVQSYRFAAADSAAADAKAKAISLVMVGGLAAAVIGPQTVIWTRDMTPAAPFAASFLGLAALALISIPVLSMIHAPPLTEATGGGRPLSEIMRQPRFITAVVTGLVSYGLMSFLMTAAPIAMVGCGHSVGAAALGIQWHVIAMFGPSFFTGHLIQRFGKETIVAIGLAMIAAAAAINLTGLSIAHFWIGLILLGVGWNFGFVGATALVTDCHRPEERAKVQAANDFLVFGSVALASLSSGKMLNSGGWEVVNWIVFPVIAVAIGLVITQARLKKLSAAGA